MSVFGPGISQETGSLNFWCMFLVTMARYFSASFVTCCVLPVLYIVARQRYHTKGICTNCLASGQHHVYECLVMQWERHNWDKVLRRWPTSQRVKRPRLLHLILHRVIATFSPTVRLSWTVFCLRFSSCDFWWSIDQLVVKIQWIILRSQITYLFYYIAFHVSMLLDGQQEEHPARKKLRDGVVIYLK